MDALSPHLRTQQEERFHWHLAKDEASRAGHEVREFETKAQLGESIEEMRQKHTRDEKGDDDERTGNADDLRLRGLRRHEHVGQKFCRIEIHS